MSGFSCGMIGRNSPARQSMNACPLKSAAAPNPKGIPQQSPGLRGTSYPGIMCPIDDNPERVAAHGNGSTTGPQPRWGCETPATFTQGSSFLATLGFVAESLWDSFQESLPGSWHHAPPFSGGCGLLTSIATAHSFITRIFSP